MRLYHISISDVFVDHVDMPGAVLSSMIGHIETFVLLHLLALRFYELNQRTVIVFVRPVTDLSSTHITDYRLRASFDYRSFSWIRLQPGTRITTA